MAGECNAAVEPGAERKRQPLCTLPACSPDERPEDEVTVTFKAGSKVEHDVNWVSYVKESAGGFGAIGDAAMQLGDAHGGGSSIVSQALTYEVVCLVIAVCLALFIGCRKRGTRQRSELPR